MCCLLSQQSTQTTIFFYIFFITNNQQINFLLLIKHYFTIGLKPNRNQKKKTKIEKKKLKIYLHDGSKKSSILKMTSQLVMCMAGKMFEQKFAL